MEKRIINISATDTWTDTEIIEDLSKQIYSFGDNMANSVQPIKVTLIIERVGVIPNRKRKTCRCYEQPPIKHYDKCDTCGRLYEEIK